MKRIQKTTNLINNGEGNTKLRIEKLYNMDELCEILGISRVTAYKLCKYGKIRYLRIGFRNAPYRFTREFIEEVIRNNTPQQSEDRKI